MPDYMNLRRVICAMTLALGLAACGGGGGGGSESSGMDNAARDSALTLSAAIQAAMQTGADGTFDDTPYGVAPSVTATHDGTTVTIEVTETGVPQDGTAREGAFSVRESGPASVPGWTGARFQRGEASEHLVVYTDVGTPEAMAFTPENLNKLQEVSDLTGEAVPESGLAIESAWFPVIRSTSLAAATPRGSITYGPTGTGDDEGLVFTGAFSGAPGEYNCSGSTCSLTLNDTGAPTAMGGDWSFAPAEGAMVNIPDYDHLHFGWWLDEREDAYGFQSFADAVGFPEGAGTVEAAMEGTATYRGSSAGVWATQDVSGGQVTRAHSGEFTAEVMLTANFFGSQDAGVVSGEIESFRDARGRSMGGWQVTLDVARLTIGAASFAGGARGELGPGSSGAGSWEGQFHGSDGAETNARPSHVTGRFDLHFPGAHIAGAFGGDQE